jgi:hypothetical protein
MGRSLIAAQLRGGSRVIRPQASETMQKKWHHREGVKIIGDDVTDGFGEGRVRERT